MGELVTKSTNLNADLSKINLSLETMQTNNQTLNAKINEENKQIRDIEQNDAPKHRSMSTKDGKIKECEGNNQKILAKTDGIKVSNAKQNEQNNKLMQKIEGAKQQTIAEKVEIGQTELELAADKETLSEIEFET